MTLTRKIALGYFVVLLAVAALNYVPGLTDAKGLAFGIFALDIYDDGLHLASALLALSAALWSHKTAKWFLILFGAAYLADGALGLVTGVGYLDLAICTTGPIDLPFGFKILANLPHIGLGGFALTMGLRA
jgi:hypothetical protein